MQLRELQAQDVTVDHPVGSYEKPASPVAAGALNLLTWPLSVIWSAPEAAIDADNINKREKLYYYTYDEKGRQ